MNNQNETLAKAYNKVEDILIKYDRYFTGDRRRGRDKQIDDIRNNLHLLRYILENALEKQSEYKKMLNGYYYPAAFIKEKDL